MKQLHYYGRIMDSSNAAVTAARFCGNTAVAKQPRFVDGDLAHLCVCRITGTGSAWQLLRSEQLLLLPFKEAKVYVCVSWGSAISLIVQRSRPCLTPPVAPRSGNRRGALLTAQPSLPDCLH